MSAKSFAHFKIDFKNILCWVLNQSFCQECQSLLFLQLDTWFDCLYRLTIPNYVKFWITADINRRFAHSLLTSSLCLSTNLFIFLLISYLNRDSFPVDFPSVHAWNGWKYRISNTGDYFSTVPFNLPYLMISLFLTLPLNNMPIRFSFHYFSFTSCGSKFCIFFLKGGTFKCKRQ